MTSLIKHHFCTIDALSYFIIAIIITGGYLAFIPPTFLFAVTAVTIPISLYYYNDKGKVNRFLISLPVSMTAIIQSKYLFAISMTLITLLFQGGIMILATTIFGGTQYIYDWRDIISLFTVASIFLAIVIPIYQLLQSFILATSIVSVLFCVGLFSTGISIINIMNMENIVIFNDLDPGLVLLIEKYIPYEPYFILTVTSLILLYISMKISIFLFKTKDN